MSVVTKTLGLGTKSVSCSKASRALKNYGGSMMGGIERLVKKVSVICSVRGVVIGSVVTAVLFKAKEKIAENEKEKLKQTRRRFREKNGIKEAIVTASVEMPAINVEEKELFDTADIQK